MPGVVIAGVGQGLAYLGAQALLDNVAPADRRGALMSAFFLVLYIAAAVEALAVGVSSGPLGLRTATIIVATCLTSPMSFRDVAVRLRTESSSTATQ